MCRREGTEREGRKLMDDRLSLSSFWREFPGAQSRQEVAGGEASAAADRAAGERPQGVDGAVGRGERETADGHGRAQRQRGHLQSWSADDGGRLQREEGDKR